MKDKTIENQELSNFGLVKRSEFPVKGDLNEFKYSMFILTEEDLFYFYEKKNKTDIMDLHLSIEQPQEIKLTAEGLEKIKDFFKNVTLNKYYRLTEVNLKKLLGIIENNQVTLKTTKVTLQTKGKKLRHIDFPQSQLEGQEEVSSQNCTNQNTAEVNKARNEAAKSVTIPDNSDAEFKTNKTNESRTLSSEINTSIQDFLRTVRLQQTQNPKTINSVASAASSSNENLLLEHLRLDLVQREMQYKTLLHAVKKTVEEVCRKGSATDRNRAIIIASELARIEKTTTAQIKTLFMAASRERYKSNVSVSLKTLSSASNDIDLSKIFHEKPFDLLKQLQTIKLKPETDLKQFVMELIAVLDLAILKINQIYCPVPIKKIAEKSDVEGSEHHFAQQYVDRHRDANKQLMEMKEHIINQLNSFEEDGYLPYISVKHLYKAQEFVQDKSGIYFNEISAIEQEIEQKKQAASKILKKMVLDIRTAKSQKIAMAEMELYLNFGIDFSDLKKKFIETQKKFEDIRRRKPLCTPQESESLQKKIDCFLEMLKQEQRKRQEKIKDFESFLSDQLLASTNIAPQFIIALINYFKKEVKAYICCDTSLNEFVRNINYAIQTYLSRENLDQLPFYGNQNKEFLLSFFDVMNMIFNVFNTDSNKTAHFFSRAIKEIEYAKTFEQFTQIIANVTQLLIEPKGVHCVK